MSALWSGSAAGQRARAEALGARLVGWRVQRVLRWAWPVLVLLAALAVVAVVLVLDQGADVCTGAMEVWP